MARNAPSNTDDVIDSRDILARIEELQAERDALVESVKGADEAYGTDIDNVDWQRDLAEAQADLKAFDDSDEGRELQMLTALADECKDYASDWEYGETLIRDTYFETYARELADDCGMIDPKLANQWPYTCIDWEAAAEALQQDYTAVDFDGETYWIRSC